MDQCEFYLRLMLMNSKVLNKVRALPKQLCIPDVDTMLLFKYLGFDIKQQQQFYHVDDQLLQQALYWLKGDDHHLVTYHDACYPPLLREISVSPLALFVKGNKQNLLYGQLAMVGSRNCSQYGKNWGYHFSYQLALNRMIITSGLALGIDSICHRAVLDAGGRTIAVLGSGLNLITPRSHCVLADRILTQEGTLVSEFFPNIPALAAHFPRRNRIISGLSWGVMVVEATLKSGSLITARHALEQGREVFALPGPIDNHNSAGTHWLLQQGAYLVTHPTEIMEQFNQKLNWLPPLHTDLTINEVLDIENKQLLETEQLDMAHEAEQILQLLSQQSRHQPITVDKLSELLDLPVAQILVILLELELIGKVFATQGGYQKK